MHIVLFFSARSEPCTQITSRRLDAGKMNEIPSDLFVNINVIASSTFTPTPACCLHIYISYKYLFAFLTQQNASNLRNNYKHLDSIRRRYGWINSEIVWCLSYRIGAKKDEKETERFTFYLGLFMNKLTQIAVGGAVGTTVINSPYTWVCTLLYKSLAHKARYNLPWTEPVKMGKVTLTNYAS